MGIVDGQAVDAANSNPAWLDANADDFAQGKIGLQNNDVISGKFVNNSQRYLNNLGATIGLDTSSNFSAEADATGKTYGSPTNTIADGDTHKTALTKLGNKFDPSTGHAHSGSAGDGAPIIASTITSVPFRGYFLQASTLSGVTGGSTNVSTQMSGKTPSSGSTVQGVVVTAPYNKVVLRNSNGDDLVDGSGNVVYGRVTESTGVWTLTYYVDITGTETPYSFASSTTVQWFYQELFNPMVNPPVYSELAIIPSDNPTQDVLDATTTQKGKVLLSSSTPSAVSATANAGTANATVANADHTHAGTHSLGIFGDAQVYLGDVKLKAASSNITFTNDVGDNAILVDAPNSTVGYQEIPAGAVNGSNTSFGPLSFTPTNDNSVWVYLDRRLVSKTEYTISGGVTVQFSTAPALGQDVQVVYLTGGIIATPPVISGVWKTEYRTVTSGEASAKQLTLAHSPAAPTEILVDVYGLGGVQWYGTDFNASGSVLDWNGLGMDTDLMIAAGDKIRVAYVY